MRLRTLFLVILVSLAAATVLVVFSRKPTVVVQTVAAPNPTREVMVAKRALKVGEKLEASAWEWMKWPEPAVTSDVITRQTLDQAPALASASLRRRVALGAPIKRSDILIAGQGGIVSAEVRPGMRALNMPMAKITNGADYLVAGDYVDLMLPPFSDQDTLYTEGKYIELRGIRVIEVVHAPQSSTPQTRRDMSFVTVEVTPEQETMLAAGLRRGDIVLSVRSFEEMYDPSRPGDASSARGATIDQETAAKGAPETHQPNVMLMDRDVVIMRGASRKSLYSDR
ncbi:MAG: Flp pilus assembly protein CpaB [Holosporales bacterium]